MSAGASGGFRWDLERGTAPPGGYYKGLAIWARSPRIHEAALDAIRRFAPPPARVLELGAGSGAFCQRLLDQGYREVEAVELRAEDFGAPGVTVHPLDLEGPFVDQGHLRPADVLVSLEVLEHLENPWAFARQCARLVRPGGLLVVSTPNIESARSRVEFLLGGEFRYFDREAYERIGHRTALMGRMVCHVFEAAGFERLERTFDEHQGPRPPLSARKALRWLLYWLSYPFMRGDKKGEVSVLAFRRKGRDGSGRAE